MSADFPFVLTQKRKLVWQQIQKYLKPPKFPGKMALPAKYQPLLDFHSQITKDYPSRLGKYVRPTLLLLAAQSMGVPERKALLTAAAMQTSEDWLLIHDDLEDDSLKRRGRPTLHQIYGPQLAINAGDALHLIMWKILWDNIKLLGAAKANQIAAEFYQMLTRTAFGQTVEIKWTQENKQNLNQQDIFLILDGKTSYYTIAGPLRLGAILADATPAQLEKIWQFGQYLGRCFQIIDDLLDLTSDFAGLKKQTGNDIYEGKRTIMLMHLLQHCPPKNKNKLRQILAKSRHQKTQAEVAWVIGQMKKCGSLDYARKLAQNLSTQSLKFFQKNLKFFRLQPARSQLESAVDFIVNRNY